MKMDYEMINKLYEPPAIANMEDLNRKLKDLHKMRSKSPQETLILQARALGYGMPLNLSHNHVEVRPSPVHGVGVFATQDIPANTIMTFYQCSGIYIDEGIFLIDADNEKFKERVLPERLLHTYGVAGETYGFKQVSLVGDPGKQDNKLLLGHLINDGSGNPYTGISYSDIIKPVNFKNAMVRYFLNNDKINCKWVFHKKIPVVPIVSKRLIKKDEELFVRYEPSYWFDLEYDKNTVIDNEYTNLIDKVKDKAFVNILKKYI